MLMESLFIYSFGVFCFYLGFVICFCFLFCKDYYILCGDSISLRGWFFMVYIVLIIIERGF